MTRFKLATRTQMIVMTVAWLGVLVAIRRTVHRLGRGPHVGLGVHSVDVDRGHVRQVQVRPYKRRP